MSRTSSIRKEGNVGANDSGSSGPDTMYVVDLIENGRVIETRRLPGKSESFARDVAENWDSGLIQLLTE